MTESEPKHLRAIVGVCVVVTVLCLLITAAVASTVIDQKPQVDQNREGVEDLRATDVQTLDCLRGTAPASTERDRCLSRVQAEVVAQPGKPGKAGARGARGVQGVKGAKGAKGNKGDRGGRGPGGPRGAKGTKGDKGDRGEQGSMGGEGRPGADAEPRPAPSPRPDRPGPPPRPGPNGPGGPRGPQGEKGDTGPKGEKGDPGEPGKSVVAIETACPTGLLGGLTPGVATDPDGDGVYTCPPS